MTWQPPLLLNHPTWDWTVDLTRARLEVADLDGLGWDKVFECREKLEAGHPVNTSEKRQVGHYWLRAPLLSPTVAQAEAIGTVRDEVKEFADDVHSGKIRAFNGEVFTHVLHIGIGGSVLGPAFVLEAMAGKTRGLTVSIVDNIDPAGILRLLHSLEDHLDQSLVIVASKSGSTVETMGAMQIVREHLESAGIDFPRHAIAVTTEGSSLATRAASEGWLRQFRLWPWVGGRFSSTSAVGLLPFALAGVDTAALLEGAREMDRWTRSEPWSANPASLIAGGLYVSGGGKGNKNLAVIPYADNLSLFPRFLQQLVMESIGKRYNRDQELIEQGLTVYGYKGSTDQHAYVQQLRDGRDDALVLFVQALNDGLGLDEITETVETARNYLQGFLLGTRQALQERNRPSLLLTIPRIDAYNLGALVALFERVISFYADLIEVNGYDQPGVEAGKSAAQAILKLRSALHEQLQQGAASIADLSKATGADYSDIFYLLERDVANGILFRSGTEYSKN
jgi:glucose-6-phosphate isomerase